MRANLIAEYLFYRFLA